jgi:hypothetical protein
MTLPQRISDSEIEANASEIAAAVLEHPLAHLLDWDMIAAAMAVAAGARPTGSLRPPLVAIDAAEIALGLELTR